MKSKVTTVVAVIQALAALIVLGAVKLWAPVCTGMLKLESGKEVFMKCHYSGQAAIALAVVLLAAAVVTFFAKGDHKLIQVVSIAGAVMLFLVFTSLIGICANPDMACNQTALWVKAAAVVTIVAAIVDLLSGKKGQVPN